MDLFALIGGPSSSALCLSSFRSYCGCSRPRFDRPCAARRVPSGAERLLYFVDGLSTAVGKTFGWCILILTFTTSYEVFARYMFGAPTDWAFDASYMLYGTLFMMAGAYALSRNGHVRGDFHLSRLAAAPAGEDGPRALHPVFLPRHVCLHLRRLGFAELSRRMNEHSSASPNGPIVWPFKWLIPIVGCLMVLQGIVEVIRCIMCIRTGEWPQRLHDVEELDKVMLAEGRAGEARRVSRLEETGLRKGDI